MTKKLLKSADGFYHIKQNGGKFSQRQGSRAQVMHGTALQTTGGLQKSDLVYNRSGKIVSKAKSKTAKKENGSRLKKKGYGLQRTKGKFGVNKLCGKKTRKNRK